METGTDQSRVYYTQEYKDRKQFETNWKLGATSTYTPTQSNAGSLSYPTNLNAHRRIDDSGISFGLSGLIDQDGSKRGSVVDNIDSGFLEDGTFLNNQPYSYGYRTSSGNY